MLLPSCHVHDTSRVRRYLDTVNVSRGVRLQHLIETSGEAINDHLVFLHLMSRVLGKREHIDLLHFLASATTEAKTGTKPTILYAKSSEIDGSTYHLH